MEWAGVVASAGPRGHFVAGHAGAQERLPLGAASRLRTQSLLYVVPVSQLAAVTIKVVLLPVAGVRRRVGKEHTALTADAK